MGSRRTVTANCSSPHTRVCIARRWPGVRANAVDPGWVPTRMGGPGAPDDLELGHLTQTWLAVSDDREATVTGGYWHHQRRRAPVGASIDQGFQNRLLDELARLTGVRLPEMTATRNDRPPPIIRIHLRDPGEGVGVWPDAASLTLVQSIDRGHLVGG